ncbi:hypothetical protein SAMN04488543_3251 [Friedmanniella luteola]|uniref:Uncharacterized protein n=1 Tax=Friedmanniella luteola TaxID=546871 RepID=A0A1H1YBG8_9ACTN|nr:hypothetical protein [Friedmanniella luteola]SDT18800.1 hypothetical protein SAMN04488543_3251 [Friedmanniella luteola]
MDAVTTTLLEHLLDDRPAPGTDPTTVVAEHARHRDGGHAAAVGRLVVPDTALVATGRVRATLPGSAAWPVTVEASGGAGGVAALAGRSASGLRVEAVETVLRDLDDLSGAVGRVAAAAATLTDVAVFVELPAVPGWVRAVEAVEAAGLLARVTAAAGADAVALADRLSVLVEADLPFAVVLPPGTGRPGLAVLGLAMLVEALVDGAEPAEAAALLSGTDPGRVRAGLARWDAATATRVRRRLRAVSTDLGAALADLTALGALHAG